MPTFDKTTCRFNLTTEEKKIKKWVEEDYRVEARRDLDPHGNFEFTDKMMKHGER